MVTMNERDELIRSLPKVALHDHLDGSLRVDTVMDLARQVGYDGLPANSIDELAEWFRQDKPSNNLETYLQAFGHTIAVLQEPAALQRAVMESVEDLAADGVVYGEIRFAPELNTRGSMSLTTVVDVASSALAESARRFGIEVNLICCAMRNAKNSLEVAREVLSRKGSNVVGFDLAGPERGYPASLHREALQLLASEGVPFTLHAGEGDGVESISDALDCGAKRIGHGVRIFDDMVRQDGSWRLGSTARRVRDTGVVLEVCPTSNLHTGIYHQLTEHPVDVLYKSGFAVTINTDNRLMSATSISNEFSQLRDTFGWGVNDFYSVTQVAARAAFADDATIGRVLDRLG
jgi:adenosine deaminase